MLSSSPAPLEDDPGMTGDRVQAPKGTSDLLPPFGGRMEALESAFAVMARLYGYQRIITPTFEHTEVFLRLGEATDVVRKEMYSFSDKGDRAITLRPEGTAPVVRAFVEHGVAKREPLPWKVFYGGPFFRYENPQKGRTREFRQVGVEALGDPHPDLDAEVIDLAMSFLRSVGSGELDLLVNSMGDSVCRPGFVRIFSEFLSDHADDLCAECRERISTNPLRALDCKACREVTEHAPRFVDHLCDECRAHFGAVREGLAALGWDARVEPRLVRGLDYYTRTTFEVQSPALDAAQNALGGGGRYDYLVGEFGGEPEPAMGFALGCDRTLAAGAGIDGERQIEASVVDVAESGAGRALLAELRRAGIAADAAGRGRSFRSQMRACERRGVPIAVIVGPDEEARGAAAIKDLRTGTQIEVPRAELVQQVKGLLS
jgi:histidyl-tRNA synthetase